MPDPEICEYLSDGPPGGPTLFFIHGWPDDARLWDRQVAAMSGDYRCVRVTLPNFGSCAVKAGGFDFPALLERLRATLDVVQPEGRVVLFTHDWGAYLGYLLEQAWPERVRGMIALDVGGHVAPSGFRERLFIVGYQWTLIALWLLGGIVPPLGNMLTRRFARLLGVRGAQAATLRSRCNYPYFYLWRSFMLPWWRRNVLRRYAPQCPLLFLWGREKPVMFHSERWLSIVAARGGTSEGIAGAGHWLQLSHADEVHRLARSFLDDLPD